jgi:hypothetical protein
MRAPRTPSPVSATSYQWRHIDDTSLEAYADWLPKLNERKRILLAALGLHDGAVDDLAERTGIDRENVASVLSKLRRQDGLIRASGMKGRSVKGKSCKVWTLGRETWFSPPKAQKGRSDDAGQWKRECRHLEEVGDVLRTALREAVDVLAHAAQGPSRRELLALVAKTTWLHAAIDAHGIHL